MTQIHIDPDGLRTLLDQARRSGTVDAWCVLALEYAINAHKQGNEIAAQRDKLAETLREIAGGGWNSVIEPTSLARVAICEIGLDTL